MNNFLPEGYLIDTKENKAKVKSLDTLREAMQKGDILEARAIVCDSDHNLIVDLGCTRGIIPKKEGAIGISDGTTKDIALISKVNKPICFQIMDIKDDVAVLSRARVQNLCKKNYIEKLVCGDIIKARVTHLDSFGCFVDIGCGIASLIPIDSISISRISHSQDRFKIGQDIFVVVKTIEEDGRISLSHKELLGTWEENALNFKAGQTVAGIVRSIEDYGIFIELAPNLAGLAEAREGIKVGQKTSVYIKSLMPEKMKIKLVIVDCFDDDYTNYNYEYFIKDAHIDRFRYSPKNSNRIIETIF